MMEGEDGDTVGRDMDGWVFLSFPLSFCLFPLSFYLVNLVEVWVILWLGGLKL